MGPNLKYGGEALFLVGTSLKLLRWAMGAVEDGDAPSMKGNAAVVAALSHAVMTPVDHSRGTPFGLVGHPSHEPGAPPGAGDPALFPAGMLEAMTPEQRAKVIESLASQRLG